MSLRQMLVMVVLDITDLCDDLLSSIQMNIMTNNRSTQTRCLWGPTCQNKYLAGFWVTLSAKLHT